MTLRGKMVESGNNNSIGLNIIEDLLRSDGSSRNSHCQKPHHGYMVSRRGGRVYHLTPEQMNIGYLSNEIQFWVSTTKLPTPYNSYYGVWFDTETNILYLDISYNFQTFKEAENFAKANDQLAIYDIDAEETITLSEVE